jgi:hypothetical protein
MKHITGNATKAKIDKLNAFQLKKWNYLLGLTLCFSKLALNLF